MRCYSYFGTNAQGLIMPMFMVMKPEGEEPPTPEELRPLREQLVAQFGLHVPRLSHYTVQEMIAMPEEEPARIIPSNGAH